jgi:hypothetical protein
MNDMGRKKKSRGSTSAYFRDLFNEHPDWLQLTDNDQIYEHWKATHDGKEMPKNIKQTMSTVKSRMRNPKKGKKRGRPGRKPKAAVAAAPPAPPRTAIREIEALERQIDDCLSTARAINVENIMDVIAPLRRARNNIVLMFDKRS